MNLSSSLFSAWGESGAGELWEKKSLKIPSKPKALENTCLSRLWWLWLIWIGIGRVAVEVGGHKKYASKSHRPGTAKTFPFSTMLVCEENFFFSLLHRRSAYYNNRQTKLERGNYKNEMQIPFSAKLFPRSFSREFLQVLPRAITELWHDCLDGVGRVEEKEREREWFRPKIMVIIIMCNITIVRW